MSDLPAFTGLRVHRDTTFGFVVLVPDNWHQLALSGSDSGVFYAPDESDLLTGLAIDAVDLGTTVGPGDLSSLRRGVIDGLRHLESADIHEDEAAAVGDVLTLEAQVTFRDGEVRRKRWIRLLYRQSTQLRLVAQAASVEAFDYWEPMFFEAMRTVRFGDAY